MSDGQQQDGQQAQDGQQQQDGQQAQDGQQQQQQQQQQQAPAWISTLTDEALRGNEHLARYKSIDDLAKGHVETMTWARGRVPLPAADDEKGRQDFIAKARPASPDDYKIPVPEGQTDTTRADGFKQKAHALGLLPWQAEELAAWNNAVEGDAVSKMTQGARDELKTREVNLGPAGYARGTQAIANMLDAFEGMDGTQVMTGLESAFGAGPTFDFLLAMAEKTGELEKVSGADIEMRLGSMSPTAAQKEIDTLMSNREFMAKAATPGTKEKDKWDNLNKVAAGG